MRPSPHQVHKIVDLVWTWTQFIILHYGINPLFILKQTLMARFLPSTTYGKLDDFIIYRYRGKPCIRRMPAEVRQTEATRKKASVFGRAATMGRVIRIGMNSLFRDLDDKGIMNRLNGCLVKCLNAENPPDYSILIGFDFAKNSSISARLKKFPELSFDDQGKSHLSIPLLNKSEQFRVPASAVAVDLKLTAVCLDPENPTDPEDDEERFQTWSASFDLTKGFLEPIRLELPFTVTNDQLILVGVALRCYDDDRKDFPNKNEKWVPTGIVAVGFERRVLEVHEE